MMISWKFIIYQGSDIKSWTLDIGQVYVGHVNENVSYNIFIDCCVWIQQKKISIQMTMIVMSSLNDVYSDDLSELWNSELYSLKFNIE